MLNMLFNESVCSGAGIAEFPSELATVISSIVNIIKIGIPLLLIIFGMIDLGKAVVAQKEDEIKKGQQTFIKRLIAAVIVFFVVFIVQIVVGLAAGSNSDIWTCVDAIIKG